MAVAALLVFPSCPWLFPLGCFLRVETRPFSPDSPDSLARRPLPVGVDEVDDLFLDVFRILELLGLLAFERVVFARLEGGFGIEIVEGPAGLVVASELFALELGQ